MGLFSRLREGLKKTKDSMIGRMNKVLNSFTKIDEELFESLEETLIMSDVGVETSVEICSRLRERIKAEGVTDPSLIMGLIQDIIREMLGEDKGLDLENKPAVIMVIGVNGAGKTTTIGKLCYQFKNEGKKVVVAAADTFRAAAIDQLEVWTQRAGVDIVKHQEGSDPASVVFDGIDAAKARGADVLICDTAGRLHNKKNLMDELAKINRIVNQKTEGSSKEVLLVLDATTGQNAVNQAKLFSEAADITGIVLTKLDGTAKGGIVISIANELKLPVKLIGVGEKIEDLQAFNAENFVKALFDNSELLEETEEEEKPEAEAVEEPESAESEVETVEEPESTESEAEIAEEPESTEPEAEATEEPESAEPEETSAEEAENAEPEAEATEEPESAEPETEAAEEAEEEEAEEEKPQKMKSFRLFWRKKKK